MEHRRTEMSEIEKTVMPKALRDAVLRKAEGLIAAQNEMWGAGDFRDRAQRAVRLLIEAGVLKARKP